jgi:transcriptional regulator with XRE-family HTH domain
VRVITIAASVHVPFPLSSHDRGMTATRADQIGLRTIEPAAESLSEQEYLRTVGERLRAARELRGLSRREVQEKSGGMWRAGAIGTYERGQRAITVVKLAELAEFYQCPIVRFLPDLPIRPTAGEDPAVVLDLRRVPDMVAIPADPLIRYAQREGSDSQALTIRASDLNTLAIICGVSPLELTQQLIAAGVLGSRREVAC